MKLEEGMYVRHHNFGIGRIINSYESNNKIWFNVKFKCYGDDGCHCGICEQSIGFKASHNIIDLIEVGDYVNGYKIFEVYSGATHPYVLLESLDYCPEDISIYTNEIKSIVTKEQFENVSYKVK